MYKILIVDDEENIRALLKGILSDVAEVYEAENAKKGLAMFQEHKPDLILLDIMLPDISGVELLQEIREKNSDVKIIMITAYETIKSVIEIMNIKISGYITKPFIVKDVRERVKKLLEKVNSITFIRM